MADIPWESLLEQADRHQLLPLLHVRVGAMAPPEQRKRLRSAYLAAAAKNLRLYAQLEQILSALNARQIPVILLKGACLAQEVYGNIGLRPMTDIDLLARSGELAKVVECLGAIGYATSSDEPIERQCAKAAHIAPLTRADSFPIEIHGHIEGPDSPFAVDVEQLWQRLRPIHIGAQQTFMLGAEDLLLHLCLHAARHAWRDWYDDFALKSVCDIAETTRRMAGLNWETLADRAIDWRARRPVFLVLTLARQWLGANIGDAALERLRPADFDERFIDWARGQIVSPMRAVPIGAQAARILGREPLHRRLTLFLRRLFPPVTEIRRRYHLSPASPWIGAYYLLRFSQLLGRELPATLRLLAGDAEMAAAAQHAGRGRELRQWLMESQA